MDHARGQLRRKVIRIIDVLLAGKIRLARIVRHDHHVFLADAIAAHKLIEFDSFLKCHAERSRLIVFLDQFFERIDLRNVFPTAAVERLHEGGEADILDNRLPVEWKLQVAETLAGNPGDIIFLRQQHRFRNGDAELARQRVVEKLIVSRPPKRVVDDDRAFEGQALQRRAIERHFVRDTIDHQIVWRRRIMTNATELDVFG